MRVPSHGPGPEKGQPWGWREAADLEDCARLTSQGTSVLGATWGPGSTSTGEPAAWSYGHSIMGSASCPPALWRGSRLSSAAKAYVILKHHPHYSLPASSQHRPPVVPPPSARCVPGQPGAPQASAGQGMPLAHTPHTGRSQGPPQPAVLQERWCGSDLYRGPAYRKQLLLPSKLCLCPHAAPHTGRFRPQAGHMHI